LNGVPQMPPEDGGPWLWKDPHRRGEVIVPGHPACIYSVNAPGALYRPCGKPGQHYPCGYRCSEHAPTTSPAKGRGQPDG